MSDQRLLEFGTATESRKLKNRNSAKYALELKEVQAEWGRRHPSKVRFTQWAFQKQASDAMLSHVLRRTVGIINEVRAVGTAPDGRRADQEVPGTGCPVLWNKRRLILTAKHVVDTADTKDIRIVASFKTALVFKEPEKLTLEDVEPGQPLPSGSRMLHCEWEDLAAILLPDGSFPQSDFVDIRARWIDPPEGEMVHCCGFPSDHNVIVERKTTGKRDEIGLGIYPTVFGSKVMRQPNEHDSKFSFPDFNLNHHYLIPYESSGSKHPAGISGSATWWETDESMLIWRPNFKFAGTCVAAYRKGTVVQVIKASVVLRFLQTALPELSV
jgi:hypothetical protein